MSINIGFCAQYPEPCICGTPLEDDADIVGVLEWLVPAWRPWADPIRPWSRSGPRKVRHEYRCTHCFLNRANELLELGVPVTIKVPAQQGGQS
jgi:hypothetical protein